MTLPIKANDAETTPDPGVDSAAEIVETAVSPVAGVLTAWGKMPRVRTLLEYLARKIPGWTIVCGAGLYAGGTLGTVAVTGSLFGLLLDTGVAAWNEHRRLPPQTGNGQEHERLLRRGGGSVLTGTPDAASGDPEA